MTYAAEGEVLQEYITLEALNHNKLHEHLRGDQVGPPPPPLNIIYPTDMIFGTYNELLLYFQLTLFRLGFFGLLWTGGGYRNET